ncbi:hypothetical protein B0T17DRAFT_480953 [Bombardia bombarda]|uniref:Uncharacterized protein n=1 Tax=Bombardia bombarda TaxID=252184 RepID=A0AA40CGD6_9PEZI|nr:hypothetical protein B0T17DRAFT_480953 [Bombardia bombarda]
MVEMDDIQALLQTGSWKTSRAKSPAPTFRSPRPFDERVPVSYGQNTRRKRPPPPSVEDEADSLAKEHGESVVSDSSHLEQPIHRGDVDQFPVLLPVHEHNPERRFVILTGSEAGSEDGGEASGQSQASSPVKGEKYEANTCRKFVVVEGEKEKEKGKEKEKERRPELSKRKSHHDLPPLDTHPESSIRRSNSRRNREKALVEQEPRDQPGRSEIPKPPGASAEYLSPVIKHMTGGRDRAYWDFNPGANGPPSGRSPAREGSRTEKYDDRSPAQHSSSRSPAPLPHKRSSSTSRHDSRQESQSLEPPYPIVNPLLSAYQYNDPDDALAFMMQGNDSPARRARNSPPPRGERKSNSPPYPRASENQMPRRKANLNGPRQQIPREPEKYYGEENPRYQRSNHSERHLPRRATLERESSVTLRTPVQTRGAASGGSNPRAVSPLPSPQITQGGQFPTGMPPPSPRSSTFPPTEKSSSKRFNERSISPSTSVGKSPSRRPDNNDAHPRIDSRTTSLNSYANSATTLPIAIAVPVDSVQSPMPSPPLRRQDSPPSYWQPGQFYPAEQHALLGKPIMSFRRYSEDVQQGVLPQLPECRWKVPTPSRNSPDAGRFMTLPRVDHFDICPGCFEAVFAGSEFKHMFVPVAHRPPDVLISCNFGASPWYRIAFLMTLKYRYSDLRLLLGIASVAKRYQACAGSQEVNRIWYSVQDPYSKRPIKDFNICHNCAKMVEVILPNLAGVFVPQDSHSEPGWSVCQLHFTPDRKRFLHYFDLLEITSDRAVSRASAPNIQELADRIRVISLHEECQRNKPLHNQKWYVMEDLPQFTVCEECFDAVVWPLQESEDGGEISHLIYKSRQPTPVATCQLYSDRMRDVFSRACQRDDFDFLQSKLNEKLRAEFEIRTRRADLELQDPDDPRVQREFASLTRSLKEIE